MVHSFVTKVSTKKYLPGRSKPLTIRQTSMATKDERIGFRVPREIKTALLQIARKEDRSLAQVCDIFLRAGLHFPIALETEPVVTVSMRGHLLIVSHAGSFAVLTEPSIAAALSGHDVDHRNLEIKGKKLTGMPAVVISISPWSSLSFWRPDLCRRSHSPRWWATSAIKATHVGDKTRT